jgi:hypothetical protein
MELLILVAVAVAAEGRRAQKTMPQGVADQVS